MQKTIRGKVFVVGDNVDTDQIIPAQYLNYNPADEAERKYFGKYAMGGVPPEGSGLPAGNVPFVQADAFTSRFAVIVAGRNFGCGSSREHAPLALAEAGVKAVVAESYARIFYRNSINGAYLVPLETPQRLLEQLATGETVEINLPGGRIRNVTRRKTFSLKDLGDAAEILAAGGLFPYARKAGLLK